MLRNGVRTFKEAREALQKALESQDIERREIISLFRE